MFYIYILQSLKDKNFYVGMTMNIDRRLKEHQSGQVSSTKGRLPVKIVFTEKVENRGMARKREKFWKSGAGREKFRVMLSDLPKDKS